MSDPNNQGFAFNPVGGPPPQQGYGGGQPPPNRNESHPMMQEGAGRGRPPLSKEEERIIKECNRESFMYRGVPFAMGIGASVFAAVQRGLLRPHPHYGPTPKTVLGIVVGYFLGKFTYANTCADKFLNEAPDSNIAEAIRVRRGLPTRREMYGTDQAQQQQQQFQQQEQVPPVQEEQPVQPAPGGAYSYDDLRKMHRQGPPAPVPPPQQQQQPSAPYSNPPPQQQFAPPPEEAPRRKKVNKYGDEVFE